MDKLIAGQHATEAVELFQLFVIFVAICGGFVTVEVLSRLAEITAQLKFGKTNNIKKKWTKKQSNLWLTTLVALPMIKQIIGVLTFILGIFLYGRKSAKDSIKSEQNEVAAKQIKRKNEIEKGISNLNAASRSELQRKFTRD